MKNFGEAQEWLDSQFPSITKKERHVVNVGPLAYVSIVPPSGASRETQTIDDLQDRAKAGLYWFTRNILPTEDIEADIQHFCTTMQDLGYEILDYRDDWDPNLAPEEQEDTDVFAVKDIYPDQVQQEVHQVIETLRNYIGPLLAKTV